MDVTRAAELRTRGTSPQTLGRLARSGRLARVRHGAYASAAGADEASRHLQLIAGTWPLLGDRTVLSYASAALLHGLPLWAGMLGRVSLTRPVGGHARVGGHIRVHFEPIAGAEVVEVDGYRVTGMERTAVDMARILAYEKAVAVIDAALHARADRATMATVVAAARGRKGVGVARAALEFGDGRSESVGESLSRVQLAAAGVPAPELQVNVFDEQGVWMARCDFGWPGLGVLGEFDGKVKYRGTPEEVAAAVMHEKRREARLRDLGWTVARWGMSDLARTTLRNRIEVAFSQARPASVRGHAQPTPRY